MFLSSSDNAYKEIERRAARKEKMLKFGIDYLDDAATGIAPNDLVLLGAEPGAGKTQLVCLIARENIEAGKSVAFFALEADIYEIEGRLKFPMIVEKLRQSPRDLSRRFSFDTWYMGYFVDEMRDIEEAVAQEYALKYQNLFIHYKQGDFGIDEMILGVASVTHKTDLFILDHTHFMDYDDEKENAALKKIAKTAKTLTDEDNKAIILVAHLRKKDRFNQELVPGMDEFMGSSDLAKISTKVISAAPGKPVTGGSYETYFRVSKNRWNGGVTRYCAKAFFNPSQSSYERGYRLGWANQPRTADFREVDIANRPDWAERADLGRTFAEASGHSPDSHGVSSHNKVKNWAENLNSTRKGARGE